MSRARSHAFAGLTLFVLVFAAYSNSFNCAFQFDDNHQIVENPGVRSLSNIPRFFRDADISTILPAGKRYRPVTVSTFALNYTVSGYNPWSWHLLNILLHVVNAILVYLVCLRLLGGDGRGRTEAFAVSLLFALHPVQTATVTYISGRALLLSTMFLLAAFYLFIAYRREGGWAFLFAGPALFLLALLSKEVAVSLIGMMAVYDLVYRPAGNGVKPARYAPAYMPYLAVLGLFVVVKEYTQGYVAFQDAAYGVAPYVLTELGVFLHYCRVMLFPVNLNADLFWAAAGGLDAHRLAGGCVLLGMAVLAVMCRRRAPAAAFFIGLIFASLAPEHTVIPVADAAVEYRLYLACAGFTGLFVYTISRLWTCGAWKKALLMSVVSLAFAALTYDRNYVWADEYTFWSDVAGKAPYSRTAHTYLERHYRRIGMPEEAIKEIEWVLSLDPTPEDEYGAYNNLGICLLDAGRTEEAFAALQKAVSLMPDKAQAYFSLGSAYIRTGRPREAAVAVDMALELDANYPRAHALMGLLYDGEGRRDDALREFETAFDLAPADIEVSTMLMDEYLRRGMRAAAETAARRADEAVVKESDRARLHDYLSRSGLGDG
ncbi:MAG: tetratricopeptide repeat protein [Nitrospirae bacterium]|nr:tetratricopeptide repeat protein [Nitrospirota bacterium]